MSHPPTPLLFIVEDDDDHAELIEFSLQDCEVPPLLKRARDGEEALDYLLGEGAITRGEQPVLVLLDLNLPKVNGIEVLTKLKASDGHRGIPVVILSTSDSAKDRQRAYDSYANAYLIKPTDFESFNQLIHSLWSFWGMWNQVSEISPG